MDGNKDQYEKMLKTLEVELSQEDRALTGKHLLKSSVYKRKIASLPAATPNH